MKTTEENEDQNPETIRMPEVQSADGDGDPIPVDPRKPKPPVDPPPAQP